MQILTRHVLINRFLAVLPEADQRVASQAYERSGRLPTSFSDQYQAFAWAELKKELSGPNEAKPTQNERS